jgi:hypothetical protein
MPNYFHPVNLNLNLKLNLLNMLIEEALYSVLKADGQVKSMVEERIYPVTMPQLEKGKTFYPALVFDLSSREREQSHDGPTGLVRSRFTVSVLGPKYFDVKTLANRVRLALDGKSNIIAGFYGGHVRGVFVENESDEYVFDEVEQLSLFHVPLDVMIQHREDI